MSRGPSSISLTTTDQINQEFSEDLQKYKFNPGSKRILSDPLTKPEDEPDYKQSHINDFTRIKTKKKTRSNTITAFLNTKSNCSTKWVVSGLIGEELQNNQIKIEGALLSKNWCNSRNCILCADHRVRTNKVKYRKYFMSARFVSTVRVSMDMVEQIDRAYIDYCYDTMRKFLRKLRTEVLNGNIEHRKTPFYGYYVLEPHYDPNLKMYYAHWHLFFFNGTPSREEVNKLWIPLSKTRKKSDVRYNDRLEPQELTKSKLHSLTYASKRSAWVGLICEDQETTYKGKKKTISVPIAELDPVLYFDLIYGRRILNRFGVFTKAFQEKVTNYKPSPRERVEELTNFIDNIVLLSGHTKIISKPENIVIIRKFMINFNKPQNEDKPPPDILDNLIRLFDIHQNFYLQDGSWIYDPYDPSHGQQMFTRPCDYMTHNESVRYTALRRDQK